jgi:type IV secretory pathway VirB9-like protein
MKTYIALAALLLAGCAATPPPEIIVKHDLAPPPKVIVPPDPYATLPADIASAIKSGDTTTVFRHNMTIIYAYSPDMKYAVNCQPNMAVQIRLRYDEDTDENNVVLGDSERWSVKVGHHVVLLKPLGTNQAVAIQKTLAVPATGGPQNKTPGLPATFDVRPPDLAMITNLDITTTTTSGETRTYTLILRLRKPFTDAIEWYYPDQVRQEYAAHQAALKQQQQENTNGFDHRSS